MVLFIFQTFVQYIPFGAGVGPALGVGPER